MRLVSSLFWLLVATAASQDATQQAEAQRSLAILSTIPQCALQCLTQSLTTSTCAATDFECSCKDSSYNKVAEKCVKSSCTIRQQLTTKNATEVICRRDPPVMQPPVNETGIGLAILAYVLRMLSKIGRAQTLWWDDAVMSVAMLFLIIPVSSCGIILVKLGLGKSVWTVPFENITKIQHIFYFSEDLYLAALPAIKISMLLTYLRIFAGKSFRQIVYVLIGLNIAYSIAFILISVFQCQPISLAWNGWDKEHEGRCNNINAQSWAAAGINIALDVAVVSLPLPQLLRMQLNPRKKFLVMIMFSMGFFVTIVSVIRLQQLLEFGEDDNMTYHYASIGLWSTVEMHASVICACMPAIRNLIRRFSPRLMGASTIGLDEARQSRITGLSGQTAVSSGGIKEVDICVRPRNDDDGHFIPLENVESGGDRGHVRNYSRPIDGTPRERELHDQDEEMFIDQYGRIRAREAVSPL
ncbi:cfem domain containing protein [Zymoseptoria brevis]|uniref:Cfem domain containing protein n=1 Tax=Zymoseptoria brevis TaxID=1047168 RepID=A0A0F4GTP5_9PEZI|nr:cfem domain containing protein [Zymoseptoria brevis]